MLMALSHRPNKKDRSDGLFFVRRNYTSHRIRVSERASTMCTSVLWIVKEKGGFLNACVFLSSESSLPMPRQFGCTSRAFSKPSRHMHTRCFVMNATLRRLQNLPKSREVLLRLCYIVGATAAAYRSVRRFFDGESYKQLG